MNAARELADLLGVDRVSTNPIDLERHAGDHSTARLLALRKGVRRATPYCVVRPRTTQQVCDLLAWADNARMPVVPYGGGSGVCDAIVPEGAVVVEMRAMDRIAEVDEKSRLVTVQAGVTGPGLGQALASWGYMLGHEPQSIDISTVGGWIATRACGQLSARYGGIEDLVAGLEVVLPGGKALSAKIVPRRATGPDVASLMIGSEGSLGIVTEATLRVSPLVEERVNRCVRFDHMGDGVGACRAIAQSELQPTLVRLYDADDSAIFLRSFPDEPRGPLLLLSFDGEEAKARADRAAAMTEGTPGNDDLVAHWWAHRNVAVEEFGALMAGEGILGAHALVDTMEVSGTWSVLRELYHSLKGRLEPETDIVGCHVSHVYPDGACLYFTLARACDSDAHAEEVHDRWWEIGMSTCLAAGGSISHHHGIGRLKARWLPEELEGWWDVLRAIKRAIDPHGIMNPGALGL